MVVVSIGFEKRVVGRAEFLALAALAVIESKCSRGAVGALKHFVTVDRGTRGAAGIGVQVDMISFPKVCGTSATSLRIAPKTDSTFS